MKQDIEDIIISAVQGEELSPKAKAELENYLKDQTQREMFFQYMKIKAAVSANRKIEIEESWSLFRQKCCPRHRFLHYAAFAASIAAFVIAGILVSINSKDTIPENLETVQQIENVKKKQDVVLTLSNGEKIPLSKDISRMTEKNGTVISNRKGELAYRPADSSESATFNTIKVPKGRQYRLLLADGSSVWMNAESSITYPTAFTGGKREVFLKGEAFFNVTKKQGQPFIVHTDRFNIEVTGTRFNVCIYQGEPGSATLAEGGIILKKNEENYTLTAGQQALLTEEGVVVRKVNLDEALAWMQDAFSFKDIRLEQIMNVLSRWYDLDIFYQNPAMKDLHFTAWFRRNSSLQEVADLLMKTKKIRIGIKGRTINISDWD